MKDRRRKNKKHFQARAGHLKHLEMKKTQAQERELLEQYRIAVSKECSKSIVEPTLHGSHTGLDITQAPALFEFP